MVSKHSHSEVRFMLVISLGEVRSQAGGGFVGCLGGVWCWLPAGGWDGVGPPLVVDIPPLAADTIPPSLRWLTKHPSMAANTSPA